MFNLFGILLAVLLVQSHFSDAIASDLLSCTRKTYLSDNDRYWDGSFLVDWFPKEFELNLYGWTRVSERQNTIEKKYGRVRLFLYPNGKMIAGVTTKGGYGTNKKIQYSCNRNSIDVLAIVDGATAHAEFLSAQSSNQDTKTQPVTKMSKLENVLMCQRITMKSCFDLASGDNWCELFPSNLKLKTYDWYRPNQNMSLLEKKDGRYTYTLLQSRKLKVRFNRKGGYNFMSSVNYECDKNSLEVWALLNNEAPVLSNATSPITQTAPESPNSKNSVSQTNEQGVISMESATNPSIIVSSITTVGAEGKISGNVAASGGSVTLFVDGEQIIPDRSGNFSATTYVPEGGTSVNIEAIDLAGLSSTMSVRVDRATTQTASISFDRLNPLKRKAAINNDALALVIGVSDYKETNAKAIYADSDAKVFQDYAIEKLGVPRNRVKTLVNDGADEKDMLLATKRWLARAAKQGKTDVYIFFAGHGLASDDGSKMYLLPYDGAPELLDDTAILRDRLFSDVAAANPRSVTVFLDTCYSGTTRGTDMLIASRPIAIRALEQSIPDNFTVMTAAAGDQTAKPLEEAKHGMFSYFLMKGMEGEADADKNNEITAGELHSYVQTNVIQQSSGSQTPELQGDADRVLVRFQ